MTSYSDLLMFPLFGQTKLTKNGICLSNGVAPNEQCVMVPEANHAWEKDHMDPPLPAANSLTAPQTSLEDLSDQHH